MYISGVPKCRHDLVKAQLAPGFRAKLLERIFFSWKSHGENMGKPMGKVVTIFGMFHDL
jgi:hypothetical protein